MIALAFPRGAVTRREIGLWIGATLLARFLLTLVHLNVTGFGGSDIDSDLRDIFVLFAWFVLFRLLLKSPDRSSPQALDAAFLAVLALCVCLPSDSAIWIALTLAAIYFFVSAGDDLYRRSASLLLAALATNGFWGPILFNLAAVWLLDLETWLVAAALQVPGYLTAHIGNELVVGKGDIEIEGGCSAFRNVSLALLAWASITKFNRPYWLRSDAIFAIACAAFTVFWNTVRLTVLALTAADFPVFNYWHFGLGSKMFAFALTFAITMIAAAGASRTAQ